MDKKNIQYRNNITGILGLQQKFIDKFMAKDSSWGHLLISPVGFGKTYLSISIANRIIKEHAARHILFLAPAALLAYHESTMEKRLSMPALIVDRKKYRLLADSVPVGTPPWPEEAIVLMSIDLAKIQDVTDSLKKVEWDLVVVDEAHMLRGNRFKLLKKLIESSCIKRLLLLTAAPVDLAINGLETTVWHNSQLTTLPKIELNAIEYARTVEEVMALSDLKKFIATFAAESTREQTLSRNIEMRVSSSISAVENSLYSLSKTRNQTVPSTEYGQVQLNFEESVEWSAEMHGLWDLVMGDIDQITIDSKLNGLQGFISSVVLENSNEDQKICILTQYNDTATYLNVGLGEIHNLSIHILDGSMAMDQRETALSDFQQQGGILILTDASAQGVDLKEVEHLVHYDLPEQRSALEQRIGRINRVGHTKSIKTYALHDILDSWPLETRLLIKHGFLSK